MEKKHILKQGPNKKTVSATVILKQGGEGDNESEKQRTGHNDDYSDETSAKA